MLRNKCVFSFFFFFQAEDGIRDWSVTGVQTCALPICGQNIVAGEVLGVEGDGVFRDGRVVSLQD